MRFEPDEIKLDGLEKLTKALNMKRPPVIHLGIVGTKPDRSGAASNAVIGAAHEYGSAARNLPARSFLRIPISDHLQDGMKEARLTDEGTLKKVITEGSIMPWLEKVKLVAKAIVIDAFDTEGEGRWPKWSASYTNRKKRGTDNKILDDTGQLKGAIDAVIVR